MIKSTFEVEGSQQSLERRFQQKEALLKENLIE